MKNLPEWMVPDSGRLTMRAIVAALDMLHKFFGGAAAMLRPLAAQSGSNRSVNRPSSAAVSSVTSWPIFMSVKRQAANRLNLPENP